MSDKMVDGSQVIDISVEKAQQLFNSANSAPFRTQALDYEFVEYLESCASEVRPKTPMKIMIHIANADHKRTSREIVHFIKAHFQYKIDLEKKRLRKHWRTSRFFLIVGLAILTACLIAAHFTQQADAPAFLGATVREGLLILGWVSMWRPLEAVYDWYPFFDRIRQYKRIENAVINIEFRRGAEDAN